MAYFGARVILHEDVYQNTPTYPGIVLEKSLNVEFMYSYRNFASVQRYK